MPKTDPLLRGGPYFYQIFFHEENYPRIGTDGNRTVQGPESAVGVVAPPTLNP